jgi:hypothetical protein
MKLLVLKKILYLHKLISNNTLDDGKDEGQFRDNDDVHGKSC